MNENLESPEPRSGIELGNPGNKSDGLVATVLAAVVGAIYTLGLSPSIYVGDSGELATAVGTLGIPHPSGYPLYVLAGKLWTLALPNLRVAASLSLFSAFAAAITVALVFLICRKLSFSYLASIVACTSLAFCPSFWSQANIQRVYALNALFVAWVIYEISRWLDAAGKGQAHLPWCLFLIIGIGATNHTFVGLLLLPALAVVALHPRVQVTRRQVPAPTMNRLGIVLGALLATAVGLLPYLYLPIRSRMNPRLDWGNPETIESLWKVITRADFWERRWIENATDLLPITADYLWSFSTEFTWIGVALVLVGMLASRSRPLTLVLLAVMALNLAAMASHGSRSDLFIWHRYYIPSYLAAAIFVGCGTEWLAKRLRPGAAAAAVLIPALLFASGYTRFDRSNYHIAEDFSGRLLAALPPGATLLASDDNILFVLMYLHLVENRRPDVHLIMQGVGDADLPPLRFDPDKEPVFFTHHPNWTVPGLEIVADGLLFRAIRRGTAREPWSLEADAQLRGAADPQVPKDYLTQNLIGHFHYTRGYSLAENDWSLARKEFKRAAEAAPDNDVMFYNLGLVFERNGLYSDAVRAFERSHQINPRHIANRQKTRALDRLAATRSEFERIQAVERNLASDIANIRDLAPAKYHLMLAERLEKAGESIRAQGHRLMAEEIGV